MADYGQNMMNPGNANMQPCPVPTQDPSIRAANTEQAVQLANYGESTIEAKCGGCKFFDISRRMKDCMDEKDTSVGYCHRWQFQCQKKNTCDAYDIGGPIKRDKESRIMQAERGKDSTETTPHIPKEEIMSSISPVQEEQLPAENMGAQEYVTAARKGGQISNIIKKKRLGGIPKANTGTSTPRGTGITYDEAWATNKDGVQDKYATQADFEAYAEDWWAGQDAANESSNNENTPPEGNTDETLKCVKCVDGAIEPVLPIQGTQAGGGVCPEGSFNAKVVPDPCNMEGDKKEEKKEEEDFSGKAKQQGNPAWPSPDPYHLPFMDDTNLGKVVGWMHGAAYDWGLLPDDDKKEENENKAEAESLEEKAKDDTRITCQKCEGGYPISNLFKDKCPEGWVPASDTNPCDGADPNAESEDANEDSTQESSFDEAFANARAQGLEEFTWKGKRYHTKTREEVEADAFDAELEADGEAAARRAGVPEWGEEGSPIGPRRTDGTFRRGGPHPLDVFLGRADAGTETKDADYWYNIYKQNLGEAEPMSFEEWKSKRPDFNTSDISNPDLTPENPHEVQLSPDLFDNPNIYDLNTYEDIITSSPQAGDDAFSRGPDDPQTQIDKSTTANEGLLSCQKCDNGFPINVMPVDGKCPEGSTPDDGTTNPCDPTKPGSMEDMPKDEKKEEEKKEKNPCPPAHEWDEESKTCKPKNWMRPITKGAKIAASIKRESNQKKADALRQSVTTKSDVVFADAIGEDYQGDTNINTGKKQGKNVYSRSGAYGTEIEDFMFNKGGEATIDMATYRKLIKAGAKLDIIE